MTLPIGQGRDVRLGGMACYDGPNPFSPRPVVACHIEFGADTAASLARGAARLGALSPDWIDASTFAPPTVPPEELVGKVVACWALGALNEVRGYLHDAGARKTPGGVALWVGFHRPQVTSLAIEHALRALVMASTQAVFSADLLKPAKDALFDLCWRHHPDYQARILMTAARHKDVPVQPFVPETKYWQYGWGAKSRVFMESQSNTDGQVGAALANNKSLSKAVFASLGVPSPQHVLVSDAAQLQEAASAIGFPCVVKPMNFGGGRGVTAGIQSESQLLAAYEQARQLTADPLMVEQFIPGDEHRLMVIDGRFAAAIRREPSSVVGDGASTIRQLIDRLNLERPRNLEKSGYRRPVPVDDALASHLAAQGVQLDSVLPAGAKVTLRSVSNVSMGGIAVDVTDRIHPEVKAIAEQLAVTIGLGTVGFDYICRDITRPPRDGEGGFIEMNTTPGLDATIVAGWPAEKIGALVLGDLPGRIPVDLFVVPSLAPEALGAYLPEPAAIAGQAWVRGNEIRVGALGMRVPSSMRWAAVQAALRNRSVTSLGIVCTVEEIVNHGLPVDRVDRAWLGEVSWPEGWRAVVERSAGSVTLLTPRR